jgi:hypothetical protein
VPACVCSRGVTAPAASQPMAVASSSHMRLLALQPQPWQCCGDTQRTPGLHGSMLLDSGQWQQPPSQHLNKQRQQLGCDTPSACPCL